MNMQVLALSVLYVSSDIHALLDMCARTRSNQHINIHISYLIKIPTKIKQETCFTTATIHNKQFLKIHSPIQMLVAIPSYLDNSKH
jgi:hypothetical protein